MYGCAYNDQPRLYGVVERRGQGDREDYCALGNPPLRAKEARHITHVCSPAPPRRTTTQPRTPTTSPRNVDRKGFTGTHKTSRRIPRRSVGPSSSLVRTPPSHGGGPGFKSPRAHHSKRLFLSLLLSLGSYAGL